VKQKPSHWDFHPKVRSGDQLTFGEKAADQLRHGLGSWFFVLGFIGVIFIWIALNATVLAFDHYPYILLNLILSTLAGLQGAVLLIAAKRSDAISAQLAKHHFEISSEMHHMLQEIHSINKPERCYDCKVGKHGQ